VLYTAMSISLVVSAVGGFSDQAKMPRLLAVR